jgi:16S rRNA (uracil1498-N3)-methyltransferase
MVPRLYVPSLDPRDRTVRLPEDEAGHLRRVLRAKPGAAIRLFDGRGREVAARVASVGRDGVTAEVGEPVTPAPEWSAHVTLAQAVLKGDKIDDVIRDAVMMGVAAIQPLLTARTDVPAAAFSEGRRLERWRRIAIASAKQCGRAVVPDILPPCRLPECFEAHRCDARIFLAEPAVTSNLPAAGRFARAPGSALVLIGPEGGWADEEVALALSAGCLPVSLGPRTLRADAAAIVALSVLQYAWA